jgi:hypothetical protein
MGYHAEEGPQDGNEIVSEILSDQSIFWESKLEAKDEMARQCIWWRVS